MSNLFNCLLIILLLSGCATVRGADVSSDELKVYEEELKVKSYQHKLKQVAHVNQIGYTLTRHIPKEDVKVNPRPFLGLFCLNPDPVINRHHKVTNQEGVVVIFTLPNTPVSAAGIVPGNIILAVNDKPTRHINHLNDIIDKLPFGEQAKVTVFRGGTKEDVMIMPEKLPINVRFLVIDDNMVNAAASVDTVFLTYGLLNFVKNDDEIASVVSHEIAHIARGHVKRKFGSSILREGIAAGLGITAGVLVPGIGGAVQVGINQIGGLFTRGFSRNLEREADYFSLKIMEHGPYDPEVTVQFHERFAVEIPHTMTKGYFKTHPSSSERTLRLRKTLDMIRSGVSWSEIEENL